MWISVLAERSNDLSSIVNDANPLVRWLFFLYKRKYINNIIERYQLYVD